MSPARRTTGAVPADESAMASWASVATLARAPAAEGSGVGGGDGVGMGTFEGGGMGTAVGAGIGTWVGAGMGAGVGIVCKCRR
jgi:hypothetical protein